LQFSGQFDENLFGEGCINLKTNAVSLRKPTDSTIRRSNDSSVVELLNRRTVGSGENRISFLISTTSYLIREIASACVLCLTSYVLNLSPSLAMTERVWFRSKKPPIRQFDGQTIRLLSNCGIVEPIDRWGGGTRSVG